MPTFDYMIRPPGSEIAVNRTAQIFVKTYSKDKEGHILVTPEMTASEIDGTIDHLISELKEIKRKAKSEMQEKT